MTADSLERWRSEKTAAFLSSAVAGAEPGPLAAAILAERLARQGLYLPSGIGLTDDQMSQVCGAVREVLG